MARSRRRARLASRVFFISFSSRLSRAILVLIRRRSVSILVSPGPRPPMPTPPAARPPTCRDRLPPQPPEPPPAGAPPTDLPGQIAAPAAKPLLEVVELGQLDLRLALLGLRVLGEDVEDQRGPVDLLHLELVLEVAQLAGCQLDFADRGVGAGGLDDLAD